MAPRAVLVTGPYGSGKSSVVAEIAETLERRGVAYGAIDLDWLTWFEAPGMDQAALDRVYLDNVAAVLGNYLAAGVDRLVLAGAVAERTQVAALEAAAGISLRVARLEAPFAVIEARLRSDPTAGRANDLEVARRWLAEGTGSDLGDAVFSNGDRPIAEVAREIVGWLGWLPAAEAGGG